MGGCASCVFFSSFFSLFRARDAQLCVLCACFCVSEWLYAPPLAEDLRQVARGDAAAEDGVDGIRASLDVDVVLALFVMFLFAGGLGEGRRGCESQSRSFF